MKKVFYFLLLIQVLVSCSKDKVPKEEINIPTKLEELSGTYKVYDTLGIYLHSLDISFTIDTMQETNFVIDSLHFKNFYNEFSFSYLAGQSYFVTFGFQDSVKDKNGHSWSVSQVPSGIYDNFWKNDTIRLSFRLTNIKFWINDAVPYLDTIIKKVAVKQH